MLCGCCTRHCCIRASLQCHMDDMLQLNAIRKICAASAAVLQDTLLPGNTQKLLLHSEQQLHHSKHAFDLHVLGLSLTFILSQRTLSRSSMLHALQHWIAPPRQPADSMYLGTSQSHPRPSLMSAASGQSPWHRLELPGCAPSLMDH